MSFVPKPFGNFQRVDIQVLPPGHLVAGLMQLSVMAAAKRHGKFVADFKAQGSRLRKAQVMRIGWLTPADKTRLRSNKPQVGFVTKTFGFGNGQNALIDPTRE